MTDEQIIQLTGEAFAQLAVVEAVAQAIDVPSLIAKLTDESTRPDMTGEEANALGVFCSTAMLALSKTVDGIASLTEADYAEYYEKWVQAQQEQGVPL